MKLSVIVPCFNEEAVITESLERIQSSLAGCVSSRLVDDYEIIVVDDGSADRTAQLLAAAAAKEKRLKVICLSRNHGHQIAISAGIDRMQGQAAIVMDADLQDPPEMCAPMLRKWQEGYKIVHMKRTSRRSDPVFKQLTAAFFYRLLNRLSRVEIPLDSGDFKLLDKDVVEYLRSLKERSRYLRGLEVLAGYPQACLAYDRPPRRAGAPKYSFWKSLGLAVDGITSLSARPLRLVISLGVFGIVAGLALAAYALVSKILLPQRTISGWTSLLIALTFFSGLQLFCLGLIGEYIGRIYEEVKGRPLYVVSRTLNF